MEEKQGSENMYEDFLEKEQQLQSNGIITYGHAEKLDNIMIENLYQHVNQNDSLNPYYVNHFFNKTMVQVIFPMKEPMPLETQKDVSRFMYAFRKDLGDKVILVASYRKILLES